MKKNGLFIYTLFIVNIQLVAQITFSKYLHLPETTDSGWTVIPEDDGYFIMAASTYYTNTGFYPADNMLKTDLYGELQWIRLLDSIPKHTNVSAFKSTIKTSDGKYLISGTRSVNNHLDQALLIKLDLEGNPIWSSVYGGEGRDVAILTHELSSHNTLTFGWKKPLLEGTKVFVTKHTPMGEMLWNKEVEVNCNFRFIYNAVQTEDDNILISYECYTGNDSDTFPSVMKIDSMGNVSWNQHFEDWGFDCFTTGASLETLPNDGYAFIWCEHDGSWIENAAFFGFDSNHEVQWSISILDNSPNHLITTFNTLKATNGDIFIIGYNDYHDVYASMGYISRISPEGELLWQRFYILEEDRPWDYPVLNNLAETPDGGLVACGGIEDSIDSRRDVWILKTDEDGCLTPGCTEEFIFISKTVQTDEVSSDLEEVFFQLSPNPTAHITHLNFYTPVQRENALLKVYSLNGQLMYRQILERGIQDIDLKVGDYPSGLYLVMLEWEGRILQREKLVKN